MSGIKRDSFVFYRSFFEAISELPNDELAQVVRSACEYALNGNEIEMSGISKAVFILMKPQIDANNRRYSNGMKGGREPKRNQTGTKQEPSDNQDVTKETPNVNDNVNEIPPSPTQSRFEYSPNDNAGAWETVRRKWNEYPVLPVFPRLFLNLFTDEREKFLTMLSAHGVDDLCMAIENYAPVAADPAKYGTEAKFLYKSLPNFLKAADKYMIAPTPNIPDGVEDFTKYNALMQREG